MSTDYSRALGARLRAIRNQQGLSLQGVEDKSHGRWKAVVVGSYEERGDRAVTVQRLSELAVCCCTACRLLRAAARPAGPSSAVATNTKIVLNLESLGSLPADEAGPLARYASTDPGASGTTTTARSSRSAPRTSSRWRSSTT